MKFLVDMDELVRLADEFATSVAVADGRAEQAVERSTGRLHARALASVAVDQGELRDSVRRDTSGLARRVYSPVEHGFYQEYGTSVMAAHPWLMVHADWAHADLEREMLAAKWFIG